MIENLNIPPAMLNVCFNDNFALESSIPSYCFGSVMSFLIKKNLIFLHRLLWGKNRLCNGKKGIYYALMLSKV